MDDPNRSGSGRDRRLIPAAILALAVVIGAIAYHYSDDLIELAKSVSSGPTGHAQSRIHY
jgi:hypothetical protein